MLSRSKVKMQFILLAGLLLVLACRQLAPAGLPEATPASNSQQAASSPQGPMPTTPAAQGKPAGSPGTAGTQAATPAGQGSPVPPPDAPTPTDQPFILPGGRILFAPFPKNPGDGADPNIWCTQPFQFSWLNLPDMRVEDHPFLTGVYPVLDFSVTLSPALTHLAFARETLADSGVDPCYRQSVSLLLARLDDEQIIQTGQPFAGDYVTNNLAAGDSLAWSANGQVFAYTRALDWLNFEPEKRLTLYDLPSGTSRTLTLRTPQPAAFALSPDGTQVAFTDLGASPGLSLINTDGSGQRVIVEGRVSSNLAWHPDGKRIFFVRDQPEIAVYSVDITTGTITPITPRGAEPFLLSLSPDGSLLAYQDKGLYLVSAEGGQPLKLLDDGPGWHQVVWSPDSQYLAYTAPPAEGIFVMDWQGNGRVEVYREEGMVHGTLIGWVP